LRRGSSFSKKIFDPIYDEIKLSHSLYNHKKETIGNFKVKVSNKYGVINKKKEIILPIVYEEIYFRDYGWIIKKNDKFGFQLMDRIELSVPIAYDSMRQINDRLVCGKSGKVGVIDFFNEVIIPFEYDSIDKIKIGHKEGFKAIRNGKIGLLDWKYRRLTEDKYIDVKVLEDDLVELKTDGSIKVVSWEELFQSQFEE